jgi:hypothetical protein
LIYNEDANAVKNSVQKVAMIFEKRGPWAKVKVYASFSKQAKIGKKYFFTSISSL